MTLLLVMVVATGCRPSDEVELPIVAPEDSIPQQTTTSIPTGEATEKIQMDTETMVKTEEPSPATFTRPRMTVNKGDVLDIIFDDLQFEMEKGAEFQREMLSPQIEDLDGKRVVLRGFILAASVFTQRGIKQFVLIRDNQECCFGPGAYIYHNVQVDMEDGKTANFTIRPVTAEGVMSIRPWYAPDGKCYSVYHLKASSVK